MTEEEYWKKQKEGRSKEIEKEYTKQARIDQLEGLLRFLLKNEQINEVSINVVQSILAEGDDRE